MISAGMDETMIFSYETGLLAAFVIAVAAAFGIAVVMAIKERNAGAFLSALLLESSAILLASFVAAFAALNVLLQWNAVDADVLEAEVRSGRIALRIGSLTAGAGALMLAIREYRRRPGEGREPGTAEYIQRRIEQRTLRESCVYTATMALLWWLVARGHTSSWITALNWFVTFILDDWAIMRHYLVKEGVPPPRRNAWQLRVSNVAIFILVTVVAFQELAAGVALIVVAFFLTVLVIGPLLVLAAQIYFRGMQMMEPDESIPEISPWVWSPGREVDALRAKLHAVENELAECRRRIGEAP